MQQILKIPMIEHDGVQTLQGPYGGTLLWARYGQPGLIQVFFLAAAPDPGRVPVSVLLSATGKSVPEQYRYVCTLTSPARPTRHLWMTDAPAPEDPDNPDPPKGTGP
jgi:hypothetical protein